MRKFKAEITRHRNGEGVDTPKTFKDFDTAICYVANRSAGFVPWGRAGADNGMVLEEVGDVTVVDFGSEAYFGRITEVEG